MARTTIIGIVSKTWTTQSRFADVHKMELISDGVMYFCTIPEAVLEASPCNPSTGRVANLRGATVEITGTLQGRVLSRPRGHVVALTPEMFQAYTKEAYRAAMFNEAWEAEQARPLT